MPEPFTRRQYPTAPTSAALARSDCRTFLEAWGLSVASHSVSDFVLMASELVTNAVTHGRVRGTYGRHVGFALEKVGDTFRIEVRDTQSDKMPQEREAGAQDTAGRGLFLVGVLSDKWGIREEVIGKTVWAEKKIECIE